MKRWLQVLVVFFLLFAVSGLGLAEMPLMQLASVDKGIQEAIAEKQAEKRVKEWLLAVNLGVMAGGAAAGDCNPAADACETFNPTGYDPANTWSEDTTGGTIDEDATTGPTPAEGAQYVQINLTSDNIVATTYDFGARYDVTVKMWVTSIDPSELYSYTTVFQITDGATIEYDTSSITCTIGLGDAGREMDCGFLDSEQDVAAEGDIVDEVWYWLVISIDGDATTPTTNGSYAKLWTDDSEGTQVGVTVTWTPAVRQERYLHLGSRELLGASFPKWGIDTVEIYNSAL